MWNNSEESRQVLAEISKDFISEFAPEELEYADELLEEYYKNPPVELDPSYQPLAFDAAGVIAALTPAIAMTLDSVVKFLLDEVIKSAQTEGGAFLAKKIKSVFNPETPKEEKLILTSDQLKKIKELTKKQARRGGMSNKKAEDFALKVIGRLSLAG